ISTCCMTPAIPPVRVRTTRVAAGAPPGAGGGGAAGGLVALPSGDGDACAEGEPAGCAPVRAASPQADSARLNTAVATASGASLRGMISLPFGRAGPYICPYTCAGAIVRDQGV